LIFLNAIQIQIGVFALTGSVWAKLQEIAPHQLLFLLENWINIEYGIRISAEVSLVLSHFTRFTDRLTLMTKTALNRGSAVKINGI